MSEKEITAVEAPPPAQDDGNRPAAKAPRNAKQGHRRVGTVRLSMLAVLIGIVTGFGAVVFRDLIGLIHNLLFLGQLRIAYDANVFTPTSPWGPFVILVPVLGAIIVTFLVEKFAPETRGHSVPRPVNVVGVITKEHVTDSVTENIEIYPS